MRVHRLALLLAYCAALCTTVLWGVHTAWAQIPEIRAVQERVVSRDEFYYYDENKLRKPLTLSRSVAIKLRVSKTPDQKAQFLKGLGSLTVREIGQLYPRA